MTQTNGMTQTNPTQPKVAALIASRNRPDLVDALVEQLARLCTGVDLTPVVVECGTSADKLSKYSTISYADPDFRGKCFGHNVALKHAELLGEFDYVWVLMNDVVFDETQGDPARKLIDTLEANPRLAVLSPTNLEVNHKYPGGVPVPSAKGFRPVTTCDYLGFMMKTDAIRDVGFLNPDFKYCWGAIHELSFKLYSKGWFVAYSDDVSFTHLGGSTYGAKGANTISRDDYRVQAGRFAYDYFLQHYAENWDEIFWATAQKVCPDIEHNTFTKHREFWSKAFSAEELIDRTAPLTTAVARCEVKTDTAPSINANAPVDESLLSRINALHPWFMPVQVGGARVYQGVDSGWSPQWLANRIACRQTTIVDEVMQRYDPTGKSVLELACNVGFFGARYAERGATRVVGIEGRDYVKEQAELYWGVNQFLPRGQYEFHLGNCAAKDTWDLITSEGPFDVGMCCGLLYHVPNYREILTWLASVSREVMVIDTRVGDENEDFIDEPGDLHFNAIEETRRKIVPYLPRLLDTIRVLGFEPEIMPVKFGTPFGLRNVDDYTKQRAVTILARRVVPFVEPSVTSTRVRLHMGCGTEKRPGWVNVDANASVGPDVISSAQNLPMFEDAVADQIEACHLFEHFTLHEAKDALEEWFRVLKPGGTLSLELPNLEQCLAKMGQLKDKHGTDLAVGGIFGDPTLVRTQGMFQAHKWGWTPATLRRALGEAGFTDVREVPVTQTWRPATKINRDMRLSATKPRVNAGALAA